MHEAPPRQEPEAMNIEIETDLNPEIETNPDPYNEYIGANGDAAAFLDLESEDVAYEGAALETWESMISDPTFVLGGRDVQWPDLWPNTEYPFDGDEPNTMDLIGEQEQLYDQGATPNEAPDRLVPEETVGGEFYGQEMDERQTATAHHPPVHQWGADAAAINNNLQEDPPSEPAPPEPEPLYNPYNDGFEPTYIRVDKPDKIVFIYDSAGGIVQKAGHDKTRWQKLREEHEKLYGDNIYGRWGTKREWEDAYYFANAKTSQASLQELLKTERYASDPPKFKTVKGLFSTIEKEMKNFGLPEMIAEEIRLAEAPLDKHELAYMNVEEGGDYLFGNPRFKDHMVFAPVIEFGLDGIRQYHNVNTADYWNLRQRALQPGTTLGAGIFMTDATQLSMHSGDVSAHGVYMSLANIDKDFREDLNNGAWLLVGIIPKSKWDKTLAALPGLPQDQRTTLVNLLNRRLFHRCMEVITRPLRRQEPHEALDPAGNTRLVQYELSIYGADLQEQCDVACITRNTCPHCKATKKTLGQCGCQPPRSSEDIKDSIRQTLAEFHRIRKRYPTPLEFAEAGKKFGLNGVQRPFWWKLPNFDVAMVLSPDLLHGVHKLFFDHIHKWNVNGLGAEEFDTRLKAQLETPGERSFPHGVSQLKQLTGKDYRALQRTHVAIVANAPNQSRKLTNTTRAMLDAMFLVQLPLQTERALSTYEEAYKTFDRDKGIWIDNKSKRGKKGKVNTKWEIPKAHIMYHIPAHVRWKGTMDNFNTETMEHLHCRMLKDPWRGSNHKGWIRQGMRYNARRGNMQGYLEFMRWLEAIKREEMAAEAKAVAEATAAAEAAASLAALNAMLDGLQPIDQDESDKDEAEDEEIDEQEWWPEHEEDPEDNEDESDEEDSIEVDVQATYEVERNERRGEGGGTANTEGGGEGEGDDRGERARRNVVDYQDPRDQGPRLEPDPAAEPAESHFVEPEGPLRSDYGELPLTDGHDAFYDDGPGFPTTAVPLYLAAKNPHVVTETVGTVMERLGLPKFLNHLREHPYFASLPITVDTTTPLNIWNSYRIIIPPTRFCPMVKVRRVFAQSGLDGKDRRWDPAFYVPTNSSGVRRPELETVHDYSVGRTALIFSLKSSSTVPSPRLMVYVQRFTSIPVAPSASNGFYAVAKMTERGSPRYEVVAVSQIARPCPLAPVIKGPAARGVHGQQLALLTSLPPHPSSFAAVFLRKCLHARSTIYDDKEGHYIIKQDDIINGRYRVVHLLGQGTFGEVVEATDVAHPLYAPSGGRSHVRSSSEYPPNAGRVAIKIIRAVPKYRDASKIEIRVLKRLKESDPQNLRYVLHSLLATLLTGTPAGTVFIIWKPSTTGIIFASSRNYLDNFTPFPRRHIQDFAQSLLDSVAFLHDLQLIRTDLKPENVLLVGSSYDNKPMPPGLGRLRHILCNTAIRLIDFGSATFSDEYHPTVVMRAASLSSGNHTRARLVVPVRQLCLGYILV
ncbi:hypothetical protein FRC09_001650, partial [Ceratobasidium sp. 395]